MSTSTAKVADQTISALLQPDDSGPRRGRSKAAGEMSRIHISIPDELANRLKEIQESTYAGSITEVIKDALILYAALLDEHKNGRVVFTQSSDGMDTHRIPIFL